MASYCPETICSLLAGHRVEFEYRFAKPRMWRFDFCLPNEMIAFEVDGGSFVQGRHNRAAGFKADMVKSNAAMLKGWKLYRATPQGIYALVKIVAEVLRTGRPEEVFTRYFVPVKRPVRKVSLRTGRKLKSQRRD